MTFKLNSLEEHKGKINELSMREAMGLPVHFVPTILNDINKYFSKYMQFDSKKLVELISDTSITIEERYAIGSILALYRDPRINTMDPQMINIPESKVRLGLEKEEVESITQMYKETGILEEWIEKETPVYSKKLDEYKISKFPVTNQDYYAFILENPNAEIPSSWKFGIYPFHLSNHPVYTIKASTADEYVKWLSAKTKRKFRLPTEAEWEYAAAGPNQNEFPWGNAFIDRYCNIIETGFGISSPVGIFAEGNSYFGVSDMAGNVEEFVSDDYKAYPGGETINDDLQNKKEATYRIARGGGFTRLKDLARCKRRHGHYPNEIYVMGFRIVEEK